MIKRHHGSTWWLTVALAFFAVHAYVILAAYHRAPEIFGDVNLYEWWVRRGLDGQGWPVFDLDWVYPVGALIPMVLPALVTETTAGYNRLWVLMLVVLNAATIWLLIRYAKNRIAPIFWLGFLLALGPIWLGRLEGVIAPLAVIAIMLTWPHRTESVPHGYHDSTYAKNQAQTWVSAAPSGDIVVDQRSQWVRGIATAIATLGAWIKIAPAAIVLVAGATAKSGREFWRTVVLPGALISGLLIVFALFRGAGFRAFSVFGEQGARTLQAESVAATWFSLRRLVDPAITIAFNEEIFTFEVQGAFARTIATALDFVLPLAVVAVTAFIWDIARSIRNIDPGRHSSKLRELGLAGVVAITLTLIVFNKVGSPQFFAWVGAAIAGGLALTDHVKAWRFPAILAVIGATLTQLIYPWQYFPFILGERWMVLLAAARNLSYVLLLIWALWRVWWCRERSLLPA